jgi:hypothetical protein
MIIGFLENKLTLRGTSNNLYDYADYNETILGNKSIILTRPYDYVKLVSPMDMDNSLAYDKFNKRFKVLYYITPFDINTLVKENNIDILFIEKAGNYDDGLVFDCCKTIIHCVFTTKNPHGTLYTSISDSLNKMNGTNIPVLPYMVRVFDSNENLKSELNIPNNALVFGTYSGLDQFNIDYVKKAVIDIAMYHKNIYFIFMNIHNFGPKLENVKFLQGTDNMEIKRKFINTCDAMIYGRDGGETFGLACGEFSLCNKPVIGRKTKAGSELDILKDDMILHDNYEELINVVLNWNNYKKDVSNNGYKKFTPEYVMKIFEKYISEL